MVLDLAARVDGMVVLGRTVDDGVLEALARKKPRSCCWPATTSPASTRHRRERAERRSLVGHLIAEHGYRDLAFLGDASTFAGHRTALTGSSRGFATTTSPRLPGCRAPSTRTAVAGRA